MTDVNAPAQDSPGPAATHLGVRWAWALAVFVLAVSVMVVTRSMFWGLVVIIATDVVVAAVTVVRGTVPWRDQFWLPVPALVVWVVAAVVVSDGTPSDEALYSPWLLILLGVTIGATVLRLVPPISIAVAGMPRSTSNPRMSSASGRALGHQGRLPPTTRILLM